MKLTKPERDRRLGQCAVWHYLNERANNLFYKQTLEPDIRIRNAVRCKKTRQDPKGNKGYWVTIDFYVPDSWIQYWVTINNEEKQSTNI